MKLAKFLEYFVATLVIFVLLFSPPIIKDINVVFFLSLASGIYLGVKYWSRPKELLDLAKKSGILYFAILFMIALGFLYAAMAFNILQGTGLENRSPYVVLSYRLLLIFPVITIVILGVVDYAKSRGWDFITLARIILLAFAIQAVIGFAALYFPQVKSYLVSVMQANTGSEVFSKTYEVSRRFYGFANSLLDSFGYSLGIAAMLGAFVAYVKKSALYLISVPLLFGMAILNARTGVVIMAIGVACWILLALYHTVGRIKQVKNYISWRVIVSILVTLMSCVAMFVLLQNRSPVAVSSTVRSISNNTSYVVSGGSENIKKPPLMKSGFWDLPSDTRTLLLGSGHSVFGVEGYKHSDVGYINDIWAFGIIGTIFLYGSILFPMFLILRNKKHRFAVKIMVVFLALAFLAFSFKGRAVMANSGLILTLLIVAGISLLEHGKKISTHRIKDEPRIS